MRSFVVNKKYEGKKLNNVILKEFSGLNHNTFYKALRKKDIRVNGIKVSDNITVHSGDEITMFISDENLFSNNINIIYEDNNIVIVNKPSKMDVLGNNSLTENLCKLLNYEVYPCHRLDRNTSGLILFAKDIETRDVLFDKFKNHEIEKHYACIVYGIPKKNNRILTAFLFKDRKNSKVYVKDSFEKGCQKIITEYKLLDVNKKQNTSILDVTLHTGKTHQIRAHLAHIGYPILGDGKYGINEINKTFGLKEQQLCSYSLEFKFTTPSEKLEYLNNKKIEIKIPFSF